MGSGGRQSKGPGGANGSLGGIGEEYNNQHVGKGDLRKTRNEE